MTRTVSIAASGASAAGADPAERLARWMRPGALSLPALPPLSLYVHLPWCLRKCPYCDFNSHALRNGDDGPPEARYVDALVLDLEASLPFVWGRRVHTVFIGGGTPSLFSPSSIERLIAAIRARLPLEPGCEITLEANPGTFERERFHAYAAAGVTRLSIGVQSFDDAKLAALGRVHDAAQARAAVAEAKDAFATFNLDLMYALPGQTLDECERDVDTALSFAPPHLSIYHLTIEPNTYFARFPPPPVDDDLAASMLDGIVERAEGAGLERYEVSAFARDGHRARHNLNYWEFGDYLGIGAARTASSASPIASCARFGCAIRPRTWPARSRVRPGERDGGRAHGPAVRVHAERAAPASRLRDRELSRAHRAADVDHRRGTRRGRAARPGPARSAADRADRARASISSTTCSLFLPASR